MEQRTGGPARTTYLPRYLEKRVASAVRRCDDLAVQRGVDKIFEYELALLKLDARNIVARGDEKEARKLILQASDLERDVNRHVAKTP